MAKNRVVVFGGNGYLGGELTKQLMSRDCRVIVADLDYTLDLPGVIYEKVDITNMAQVRAVIEPQDIVVNFAGIADLNQARERPKECIEINIAGNNNILQVCVERGVKKIGYASSAYVYSAHGSFYRISKRTCEEYILEYSKKYNLPYLLLRYGSLYGGLSNPSNGMHRILMRAMTEKKLSYDGNPSDSREFIHVTDASEITADLLLGSEQNKAFLLTGLERFTMAELFSLIEEILDEKLNVEFGCSPNSDHYKMTQYNFSPIQAKRISKLAHVDLGNGIMDLINTLFKKNLKE